MEVRFEHLSKKYGRKYALKDFSATLSEGVYGLLGTNGAGKTTLLNLFMGITPKDGGEIFLDGKNIRTMGKDFLGNIGYLPQSDLFYKDFTVLEFMRYMSVLKGLGSEAQGRIKELLAAVNLTEDREKKIGALSGGMRKRLGIAQAMLSDPGILILDEPTAGLDPRERIRFRNIISRFSQNRIVILATHIVPDIEFIANQILLLHQGVLLKYDTPTALCRELEGKVWAMELPVSDVPDHLVHHTISNLARDGTGIRMRILSPQRPGEEAVPAAPTLEEVFLYHCGEDRL